MVILVSLIFSHLEELIQILHPGQPGRLGNPDQPGHISHLEELVQILHMRNPDQHSHPGHISHIRRSYTNPSYEKSWLAWSACYISHIRSMTRIFHMEDLYKFF